MTGRFISRVYANSLRSWHGEPSVSSYFLSLDNHSSTLPLVNQTSDNEVHLSSTFSPDVKQKKVFAGSSMISVYVWFTVRTEAALCEHDTLLHHAFTRRPGRSDDMVLLRTCIQNTVQRVSPAPVDTLQRDPVGSWSSGCDMMCRQEGRNTKQARASVRE